VNKEFKLKKSEKFQETFEKGKNIPYKNLFYVKYTKNNFDTAKIGLAVSKKHGNAPYRNHVKRQVRSIFSNLNLSKLKTNNYIFIFSKNFCELKYKDKKEILEEFYKKIINGKF